MQSTQEAKMQLKYEKIVIMMQLFVSKIQERTTYFYVKSKMNEESLAEKCYCPASSLCYWERGSYWYEEREQERTWYAACLNCGMIGVSFHG